MTRTSRRLGRPMRRSARLQHLQSRGTLERCDAPNDKTTRRRCWSRHLGLRHCHHRCAISRAGHPAKRPLGVAQVPGRPPTSEAAGGSYRRDRSPQSRRSQERNRYGCGDRDVITAPICGGPQYEDQRDRRISGRNSKSHSGVVPGRGQASRHCPHVSNIPVLGDSHSKRDREAKTIG